MWAGTAVVAIEMTQKDRIASMLKRKLAEQEADELEREGIGDLDVQSSRPSRFRVPRLRSGMPDFDIPGDVGEPMQTPRPYEPGRVDRR